MFFLVTKHLSSFSFFSILFPLSSQVAFEASQAIGLSLADFCDKNSGKCRTYVKAVIKSSQAEKMGIRVPWLLVSINGRNIESLPAKSILKMLKQEQADKPQDKIVIVFRNPTKFVEDLQKKGNNQKEAEEISTQLAPATKARGE